MIKKLFYSGVVAILISLILFAIVSSQEYSLTTNYLQNSTVKNITVQAGNFSYIPINLTGSAYIEVSSRMSNRANAYLFNGSGFSIWQRDMLAGGVARKGIAYASSLEGTGAMAIYQNVTEATIPFLQLQVGSGAIGRPVYSVNLTLEQPPGDYYFVIDNTNGSASTLSAVDAAVLIPTPLSNATVTHFAAAQQGLLPLALLFFMLLVAGIILLVYGFIKKSPEEKAASNPDPAKQLKLKDTPSEKQIDELYKNIGRKKRAKRRTST